MMAKSRMISIRIREDEFREVKQRCAAAGWLSVSEFIRAAMLHALLEPEESSPVSLEMQMTRLSHRMEALEERFSEWANGHDGGSGGSKTNSAAN